jgi:hypothetical protein
LRGCEILGWSGWWVVVSFVRANQNDACESGKQASNSDYEHKPRDAR